MTDHEWAIVRKAMSDATAERSVDVPMGPAPFARFSLPTPTIVNKMDRPNVTVHVPEQAPPQVMVNVDMAPVAAALDRLAEAQKEQSALLVKLLEVLAARPAINVNVPKQEAPKVTVQVPEQKPPTVNVQVPKQEPPVVNVHPAKGGKVRFEPSYDDKGKLIDLTRHSED